ncbi:MAG TPA: septum formation initiator family protein [Salinimicrobium sp.]|nr:septum formation initiator family protein [Salinimicrobium sp.]
MKLKEIRSKRWVRILSNKYVLVLLIFIFWMFFLDSNSWFVHQELNEEIEKLEVNKEYYKTEINKDNQTINKLNDSFELEKFAREEYFMKRENEDIYIIEYQDSTEKEE